MRSSSSYSCSLLRASQRVRAGARPTGAARLISFLRASQRVRAGARPKGAARLDSFLRASQSVRAWPRTGPCKHAWRLPLGVLKPAPRLRHLHNLLSKRRMLSPETGKPPETSPQNGRERARVIPPGGSPLGHPNATLATLRLMYMNMDVNAYVSE